MNEKEIRKIGSRSQEVIDYFSEEMRSDLIDAGYEGKELEEAFAKEQAAFVSAVNEFKDAVNRQKAYDSSEDMFENYG